MIRYTGKEATHGYSGSHYADVHLTAVFDFNTELSMTIPCSVNA